MENAQTDWTQGPVELPMLPNFMVFGGIREEPFVRPPAWMPAATGIDEKEVGERRRYWLVAIGGVVFAGAVVAQLLVWATVLAAALGAARTAGLQRMRPRGAKAKKRKL